MTNLIDAPTAERAAALWWAGAVGAPTFRNIDHTSTGEERRVNELAGMLALLNADRHPVTQEAAVAFVGELEKRITAMRAGWRSLSVDYGPDLILAEAAEASGVSLTRFPWKTHMTVYADHVVVSKGYRAPTVLVWHAPGWERPPCRAQHWFNGEDPKDELCGLPKYHDGDHAGWLPDPKRCKTCGGTYSQHYAGEYWDDSNRCRWESDA